MLNQVVHGATRIVEYPEMRMRIIRGQDMKAMGLTESIKAMTQFDGLVIDGFDLEASWTGAIKESCGVAWDVSTDTELYRLAFFIISIKLSLLQLKPKNCYGPFRLTPWQLGQLL
jgi:hypothetical protein